MGREAFGTTRVYFWISGSGPTLRQCRETLQIFIGERADFVSGKEVVSFFIGLFLREKGLLAFWEGQLKNPSQKVKEDLFSRKQTVLK